MQRAEHGRWGSNPGHPISQTGCYSVSINTSSLDTHNPLTRDGLHQPVLLPGGFAISSPIELQTNDYRKTANRTSDVTGVVDSAVSVDAPTRVQVSGPANPTTSSPNRECTRALGKKPTVPLLSRILRASRRSGARVDKDFASRAVSSPVASMKPLEWYSYTVKPYTWQEGQA